MTLSTEEIAKKCKGGHPGVCDLLAGHEGPHRSANGFVLGYVVQVVPPDGDGKWIVQRYLSGTLISQQICYSERSAQFAAEEMLR